jgi:hypothetical protein
MAFGDGPADEELRAAWHGFCDQLKQAGDLVFKDYNPPSPLHRVDGLRFLTQNLGQAFDLALETRDTRFPQIHDFVNPTRKLGGDNADFLYQQAWIDGTSVYKISGNKGTCRFLNIVVQGPRPAKRPGTDLDSLHEPFGDIPECNLLGDDLVANWDGGFELYIGGPKRGPNWLPTTPGSRKLFIRHGFERFDERPALLRIERVGMDGPKPLPTVATMLDAIDWAGNFLVTMMQDNPDFVFERSDAPYADRVNTFPAAAGAEFASDRKRGRAIENMHWAIGADEALIIEFDEPEGIWMLTNMGVFYNSMDFLYRPVSFTSGRTRRDADGKVRLIVTHEDPGYLNWVDTQGFERGNITYRHLGGEGHTVLHTKLVKLPVLSSALPSDSARATPEERKRQLFERFNGIRQRYGF